MNEFNEEPRDSQGSQGVEAAQSGEAPQQGGKRKRKSKCILIKLFPCSFTTQLRLFLCVERDLLVSMNG